MLSQSSLRKYIFVFISIIFSVGTSRNIFEIASTTLVNTTTTERQVVSLVITEIMQDPAALPDATGEYFEVYNPTGTAINMNGYIIEDADSDSDTLRTDVIVPAEGYAVLDPSIYQYSKFKIANAGDEIIIKTPSSTVIASVSYTADDVYEGASISLIGGVWCKSTTTFATGDFGTPGAPNVCDEPTPPCSLTNVAIQNGMCQDANYEFDVSFDVANGSGTYQVIKSLDATVLATGSSSPIHVILVGNTSETAFDIQVRDAFDNDCITGNATVNPADCTPPPCVISNVNIQNGMCQGTNYEFQVSFSVVSGSGSYEVVNASDASVLAAGNNSPISVTLTDNTNDTPFNINVQDANDNTCKSSNVSVNPEDCSGAECTGVGNLIITKIMQNPTAASDSDGEWFEVYNASGMDVNPSYGNLKIYNVLPSDYQFFTEKSYGTT